MSGRTVLTYGRVSSTNDVLRDLAARGAAEGTVVRARVQTAGRGRLGRGWVSPEGGLWCSLLKRLPDRETPLPLVTAVGVADALRAFVGTVSLKWPNDLMLDGRKVGGILIEAVPPWAIVGIGVNVNLDPLSLPEAVREGAASLAQAAPGGLDLDQVCRQVVDGVDAAWQMAADGAVPALLDRWRQLAGPLGAVRVEVGGRIIAGRAVDIDATGALIVEAEGGRHRIVAGDVTASPVGPRMTATPGAAR